MLCYTPEVVLIAFESRKAKDKNGNERVYKSAEFVEVDSDESTGSVNLNVASDFPIENFEKFGHYKLTVSLYEIRTRNGVYSITEIVDALPIED